MSLTIQPISPALGAIVSGIDLGAPLDDTGQRAIEQALLDTMYDLPSQGNVKRVVLDEGAIEGEGKPLLIYADEEGTAEKPERGEVRDAAA